MPDEKIQIVATAQDRASATLKKLSGNVNALGGKGGALGKMSTVLGGINPLALAAGVGIGIFTAKLAEGFKGAMEEEAQIKRLGVALQNNIKDFDGNTSSVDTATTSMMNLGIADDETRDAIIKLVPVTHDLQKAIDDSRLAADVARGLNIEYGAAVDIVSKAERGMVGALKRSGIAVGDANTPMELRNLLMETFGGQAEAYASTTAGQVDAANVKISESFEDLAGGLAVGAVGAMEGWEQFFAMIENKSQELQGTASTVNLGHLDFDRNALRTRLSGLADIFNRVGGESAKHYGTGFNKTLKTIRFGEFLTDNLADSLQSGVKDDIQGAMEDVKWAIAHPLAQARQAAKIEGALTTLEYKRGLASNTPEVNAVIDQSILALQQKWSSLTGIAYQKGVNAADALARGLRTFHAVNIGNPYKGRSNGPLRGGMAAGGDLGPGESTVVGERGREIFTAGRRGGHVTPNHAGGSQPIHVVSADELARLLDQRQGRMLALAPSSNYSR